MLYLQPVYISSTGSTRIPELQRIILSMNNVVVMEASLEEGIRRLQQLITHKSNTPQARSPTLIKNTQPEMGKMP